MIASLYHDAVPMNLRALRYFTTLAREGHFARAAERCGVTQPTLSAALAGLEAQIGKRLIDRDRRYIGLTPEGEAVLPWAQQLIAAHDAMLQSVDLAAGPLRGELRIGAIPAALPMTGTIAGLLLEAHPLLTVSVRSLTSDEILLGLRAFELDAGVTYVDDRQASDIIGEPLGTEGHCLVRRGIDGGLATVPIPWRDAASEPLCLLHEGMHHRRIMDRAFAAHGLAVSPRATADSFVTLLAMVGTGRFATIVPEGHRFLLDGLDWAELVPLEPAPATDQVGLVVLNRVPLSALSAVALATARRLGRSGA